MRAHTGQSRRSKECPGRLGTADLKISQMMTQALISMPFEVTPLLICRCYADASVDTSLVAIQTGSSAALSQCGMHAPQAL